ncbi:MAG: ABC transporter permease subunit, partial [Chitinophagaceae bacterium]
NSVEFIELLVSQPLKRTKIWLSMFLGIAAAIMLAFLIGVGIPVLIYQATETGLMLLAIGVLLSVIFTAFAMLAFAFIRDKAKGIGISVLLWLVTALLFDGVVLFLLFQFSDYPIEKYMLAVSFCNPIDLGRILILLKMDVSALMGYTGAIFRMFFGTNWGVSIAFFALLCWIFVPLWLSVKKFVKKDL